MLAAQPHAREAEIPRAAHMVFEDNPDAFLAAVRAFLHWTLMVGHAASDTSEGGLVAWQAGAGPWPMGQDVGGLHESCAVGAQGDT